MRIVTYIDAETKLPVHIVVSQIVAFEELPEYGECRVVTTAHGHFGHYPIAHSALEAMVMARGENNRTDGHFSAEERP